MMHIALLTHHWVPNFGANLQTLATTRHLSERGHTVTVLDYIPPGLEFFYTNRVPEVQRAAHTEFVNNNIRLSKRVQNMEECKTWLTENAVDGLIVGSDAVMQLRRAAKTADLQFPNPFWLTAWAPKKIKTAMISGSSMGCSYLRLKQPLTLLRIAFCLLAYDYLSVRDRWTQNLVRNWTLRLCNPVLTPDPVFSLNQVLTSEEVQQFNNNGMEKPYILLSCMKGRLSDEWVEGFVEISHRHGCNVYELPMPEGYADLPVDWKIPFPLSPLQWYLWLKNARGFVGQRFHSIVVCLHNSVPFVSIDSYGQAIKNDWKSKIFDLCTRSGFPEQRIPYKMINNTSPMQVYNLLKLFDCSKAKAFSKKMSDKADKNLNQLLMTITS